LKVDAASGSVATVGAMVGIDVLWHLSSELVDTVVTEAASRYILITY
jgi:hypothetical protein